MSKIIQFKNIDISSQGVISCDVVREEVEQLHIRLPYSYRPSEDLIGSSFCAIAGRAFDRIEIDLPLGENLQANLARRSQATIVSRTGADVRRARGSSAALNFSGGFDSLAARKLVPDANLISLDFGGRFSRERKYFEKYSPLIFETNLATIGLNRHSWQFMALGSILLRDELDLGSYSFGSIMAGSLSRLLDRPLDQSASGVAIANDLGMNLRNPVAGISEIAALSLVVASAPEELVSVLHSVALPKEEKFLRKHQMLNAVSKLHDLPLALPILPNMQARLRWGDSFATDLSSMFVAKILGVDEVNDTYIGGIPTKFLSLIEDLSMNFMTRFNPHAYHGLNDDIVSNWYSELILSGVQPFERKDWEEASIIAHELSSL